MKRHISYLKYVIRHKYFVFRAGLKTSAPLWRLIIHDWTKFLPGEWFAYVSTFYKKDGSSHYQPSVNFDFAWLHHQHKNKHHWQHFLLREDSGETKPLQMPDKYVREMVADWAGAGRAITGKWEVKEWFKSNEDNIILHPRTYNRVRELLRKHF